MKKSICQACGKKTTYELVQIEEKMIGTRSKFNYKICSQCGSLEIINAPKNMGEFYNTNYYSFIDRNILINEIMYHVNKSYFTNDLLGNFFKRFIHENEKLWELLSELLKTGQINYESKILDIGCGNGTFLQELSDVGFEYLNGMEPFIEKEVNTNKFKIYKSFIDDFNINKKYDLIFLKDSLEHMEDPYMGLNNAKNLLNNDGYLIITIPIKTEYFWKLYDVNWFQLDAPRHFITFTLNGFETLLKRLNLDIEKVIFNSDPYSIIISEDYCKNLDMYSEKSFATKSHFRNEFNKIFKRIYLEKLDKKTTFKSLIPFIEDLNIKQSSDHAIFLIRLCQ